jgi:hypothetical protein
LRGKDNMKKSIYILLIGLMLCETVTASSINYNKNTALFDELDQSQSAVGSQIYWVGRYDPAIRQGAQSFIPQKGILTRVELYLSRWEVYPASEPFHLAIRETLTGTTLSEISINPNIVPIYDFAWITFDLPDIPINVGETYFLVGYSNDNSNNGMYWWGGANTNPYANGIAYFLDENNPNWQQSVSDDMGFKTYGIENDPPEKPSITGTVKGIPDVLYNYTLTAIEPDGENIKYVIDWDDGNQEETEYVSSGESVIVNHAWADRGLYTVKAKAVDTNGKESEWGTFNVQMPKAFEVNSVWQWFQYQFPLLARVKNFILSLN